MSGEISLLKIVGRSQKKYEDKHEANRSPGVNLYVKNLDDRVNDGHLVELFSPFGTIVSARVMLDSSQQSKGYGFVCFTSVEEASEAMEQRNGYHLFSKHLHVSYALRPKKEPKQNLFRVEKEPISLQKHVDSEEMHANFKKEDQEDASVAPEGVDLPSRLASLLDNETFSDVQFSVEGELFYAHKLVLSLSSEVFASMFYGEHSLSELKTIAVPNITSQGFFNMLQYLYTEELEFENMQDAKETFKASQKYCIRDLQKKCQDYLFGSCEVTPANVCYIFENADASTMRDTLDKCQKVFQNKTMDVLESPGFLSSDISTVRAILRNDTLNIDSEVDLIGAVTAWGKEECKRKNAPPKGANVRACVGPLLEHLRFLSLSTEVFLNVVKETELLTTAEACLITLRLSQPGSFSSLPPGICDKTNKRASPASSSLSSCCLPFPLVETKHQFSAGFSEDIMSNIELTMQEGQIKVCGLVLEIKRLRFNTDILEVCIDANSNVCEHSTEERVEVSDEPVVIMLKKALLVPPKQSATLSITIEDLQISRCYTCQKSDFSFDESGVRLKVHVSGNRRNENGGFLFLVKSLLYENC